MKVISNKDKIFLFIVFFIFLSGFLRPSFLYIPQPSFNYFAENIYFPDIDININEFNHSNVNKKYLSSSQLDNEVSVTKWSNGVLFNVKNNLPIPRMFFPFIPKNINEYEINNKKTVFISIILPIALRGNELVSLERELMKTAFLNNNIYLIEQLSKKYKIKNFKKINFSNLKGTQLNEIKSELILKIDTIPISMILAQAIIESGWGSSRFAQEGNALFGEWTWNNNDGIKPKGNLDGNFAVKDFKNILESLNSYVLNLNRHDAYDKLRKFRFSQKNMDKKVSGYHMSNFLENYAQIGFEYVTKVSNMIKSNKLNRFDNAKLEIY